MKQPEPSDLKRVRNQLGMSQAEFARAFLLNVRTLQNWEIGRKVPTGPTAVYLCLITKAPQIIQKLLRD